MKKKIKTKKQKPLMENNKDRQESGETEKFMPYW